MTSILFLALGLALLAFPTLRCAFFHPVSLVWHGVRDLYWWLCRHGYNVCPSGELVAFTGLFGKGKTSPPSTGWWGPTTATTAARSGAPGGRNMSPSG